MAGEIRFRLNQIKKDLSDQRMAQLAENYFVNITPRRTGNAQDNTYLKNNIINANYPYAQRLDNGWSKQAPKGMTGPTIDYIKKYIKRQENK